MVVDKPDGEDNTTTTMNVNSEVVSVVGGAVVKPKDRKVNTRSFRGPSNEQSGAGPANMEGDMDGHDEDAECNITKRKEHRSVWRAEQTDDFSVPKSVEEIVEVMQINIPECKRRTVDQFVHFLK